ncbi:lipase family alpha/beta hydrolase [Paludibacterium yongneupense]|uniref:lipase family alpha/beta hydrolase n=1 Tax=Paludibacterium yongneupense TaxID=400061 RepID=UPI000416A473|nr:triacylglycerol lipase [Paludibacterium yongneupense]
MRWLLCVLVLSSPPLYARGYTETRYPIVLVHGLFGFDRELGVDYFYGVPAALRREGATVYVARVDPVNTSEIRGEQLLAQVEEIIAISGADKVNLIGHSQGAPTARYVAAVRPDLVASVTSVGGVNKGSAVADLLTGPSASSWLTRLAAFSGRTLFGLGNLFFGSPLQTARGRAALADMTSAGAARFNRLFPQALPATPCGEGDYLVDGVRYYSWSGSQIATNPLDPIDLPLLWLASAAFGSDDSDGLVGRCASHLGEVIRDDYRMNHANEVNQMFGLVSPSEIDPVALYLMHANRLQQAGL